MHKLLHSLINFTGYLAVTTVAMTTAKQYEEVRALLNKESTKI